MFIRILTIPILLISMESTAEVKNLNLLAYLLQNDGIKVFSLVEDPKPIRRAKLKVKIQKRIAEIGPGGNIYFRVIDVCMGEQKLNVYDAHKGPGLGISDLKVFSCESEFKKEMVKINIAGALALYSQVVFGPRHQEIKSVSPFMWFEGRQIEVEHPIADSYAGTTDVSSRTPMLIEIRPQNTFSCNDNGKCVPLMQEFFTALVGIED